MSTCCGPRRSFRIELSGGEDDGKGGSNAGEVVTVVLLEGSAEVYGFPLAEGRRYRWGRGAKVAVFTWYGCRLRVTGLGENDVDKDHSHVYVSDETPMVAYINTHAQLERRRDHAVAVLQRAAAEGGLDGRAVPINDPGHGAGEFLQFSNRSGGEGYHRDESIGNAAPPRARRARRAGPRASLAQRTAGKALLLASGSAVRPGRVPMFIDLDTSLVGGSV